MSNAEIASLPTGWEACCFGDIAKIRNGYAFKSELFKKSKEHETDVPLIRQSQMKGARIDTSEAVFLPGDYLKKHPDFVIAKGDVIIGMSGSIGKVCLYDEDFLALQNQRTGKIIPYLVSELNPKFFGLFLSNIERKLTEYAKGMGVQNISAKDIEQLPFNLPPKNEQHRIIAKIEELFSELDKGIENLKTARAQLKVYRQALLKHAFEGKLTAQWRAENRGKLETAAALLKRIQQGRAQRYQQQLADWEAAGKQGSKPKAPKPLPPPTAEELAELPELPEGWGWVRLGDLCRLANGFAFRSAEYTTHGVPLLRISNITQNGTVEIGDVFVTASSSLENFEIRSGDILIALSGATTGKYGQYRSTATCYLNQRVGVWKLSDSDEHLHSFILNILGYLSRRILDDAYGGAQPNISSTSIDNMTVPLCGYDEMRQLVDALMRQMSMIDQLDQTITIALQQAEALRQSILKKAFSGLLVPQDTHDEPASVLLARIRVEREVGAKNAQTAAKPRKSSTGDKLSPTEISSVSTNKEP